MVGAFGIWWGGTSAPARPIASGLPLLMLPIAAAFRSAPAGSPRRAAQHLLLWIGIGIAITLAVGQDGLLINNARDGTSALLDFWSPRWELWSLAPSFIGQRWTIARLHHAWWLAIAFAAAFVLAGTRSSRAGSSALVAFVTLAAALMAIAMTVRCLPAEPPRARSISARDRGWRRSTASTRASGQRRWSTTRSARARPSTCCRNYARREAAAAHRQAAGARHPQRPLLAAGRHLHDRRAVQRSRERTGAGRWRCRSAATVRRCSPGPSRRSPANCGTTTLWLPVMRASSACGARPKLNARSTRSPSPRPPSSMPALVRSCRSSSRRRRIRQRRCSFTTNSCTRKRRASGRIGGQTSQITVAVAPDRATPVVAAHSSAARKANVATFTRLGWQRDYSLVPGQAAEVELPHLRAASCPMTMHVEDGFSPRDIDPSSNRPALPRRSGRGSRRPENHDPTGRSSPRIRQPRARRKLTRTRIRSSNSRCGSMKR